MTFAPLDLGIGEKDIESAKELARKFDEKAIGGSEDIDSANTAVGLFLAHEAYALGHEVDVRSGLDKISGARRGVHRGT